MLFAGTGSTEEPEAGSYFGRISKDNSCSPGWRCHAEATEWKTQTQPGQRSPAGVCHLEALQPTGGCCGGLLPVHCIQVISHSARARGREGRSSTETGYNEDRLEAEALFVHFLSSYSWACHCLLGLCFHIQWWRKSNEKVMMASSSSTIIVTFTSIGT